MYSPNGRKLLHKGNRKVQRRHIHSILQNVQLFLCATNLRTWWPVVWDLTITVTTQSNTMLMSIELLYFYSICCINLHVFLLIYCRQTWLSYYCNSLFGRIFQKLKSFHSFDQNFAKLGFQNFGPKILRPYTLKIIRD